MTLELRLLLKVSIHAVKSPTGAWNACFMDKGYKATGDTPFQAIRNYMDWVEMRLKSRDSEDAIASDLGIDAIWIASLRDVLAIEQCVLSECDSETSKERSADHTGGKA